MPVLGGSHATAPLAVAMGTYTIYILLTIDSLDNFDVIYGVYNLLYKLGFARGGS